MARCFHNPDEENAVLSNWYPAGFELEGRRFSSVEQYFMWKKAVLFGDADAAEAILATDDCAQMKALGRRVRGFDGKVWSACRPKVMEAALLAKCRQNPDIKKALLETGDDVIVECSEDDRIWGNGLAMSDPDRDDPRRWTGQNLMGRSWMHVRELLRGEEKAS